GRDPGALVQGPELVGRLERSVVVGRLYPRDVRRPRDVTGHLGLLLGEMVGRELLAAELLRRAHVDEAGGTPDLREDLVAERPDLRALRPGDPEPRLPRRRHLRDELTRLELPLLAAAVQQLHGVEPPELQDPV